MLSFGDPPPGMPAPPAEELAPPDCPPPPLEPPVLGEGMPTDGKPPGIGMPTVMFGPEDPPPWVPPAWPDEPPDPF